MQTPFTPDLFDQADTDRHAVDVHRIGPGSVVLRRMALSRDAALMRAVQGVATVAPWRRMSTTRGHTMSVAMTNCGPLGWVSDRRGYRYSSVDPESGRPWPGMPDVFATLARQAAELAGYPGFAPDACLLNCYAPGSRLSLHQDRNEIDFGAPIVSVSLGVPAVFLFGGPQRTDRAERMTLSHGDVVVWGGSDRLRYHGVLPLKPASHPLVGDHRINLTFRKAG